MGRNYRYKDIQLTQLRSFCVAASRANFSTAAQELGLSASTVWEQVRALEKKLDAVLFEHRGRDLALTAEGSLLLELLNPHIDGLDSLERVFQARRVKLPQQLTVASTQYLLHYHLAGPIQAFMAANPASHLTIEATGPEVLPLVERGVADLAVAPYDRDVPRSAALEYEDLFELPLMLLTPARHPLARKKHVSFQDVAQQPMVLAGKDSYTRRVFERILHRQGFAGRLHVVMETLLFDTLQKYVSLGVGVGLTHMSDRIGASMRGLHLRVLDPLLERLPIAMVVRRFAHPSEPVQAFRLLARTMLRE